MMAAAPALLSAGASAAGFSTLGTIITVGSTLLSAVSSIQEGNAANKAAKFEATQLETKAKNERATSQLAAQEQRRQANLVTSRARAIGAASGVDPGAGVTDLQNEANIAGEGEYRALAELYSGENRARGYQDQAKARLFEGKSYKQAGKMQAASTILGKFGSSIYDRFKPEETPTPSTTTSFGNAANFDWNNNTKNIWGYR